MQLISKQGVLPSLPLNALDFFSNNPKPKSYDFPVRNGLLSINRIDRISKSNNVPVVNATTNEAKNLPVTAIVQKKSDIYKPRDIKNLSSNIQQNNRLPGKNRSPQTIFRFSSCKHIRKVKNPSCSCTSYECWNPQCPLSKVLPSGERAKQNWQNCTKEGCRWYEDNGNS